MIDTSVIKVGEITCRTSLERDKKIPTKLGFGKLTYPRFFKGFVTDLFGELFTMVICWAHHFPFYETFFVG